MTSGSAHESPRRRLLDSVAADVRAFMFAVDAFETKAADVLGLDRTALRCLVVIAETQGAGHADLAAASRIDPQNLEHVIQTLIAAGHVVRRTEAMPGLDVAPATRELLGHLYGPLEADLPSLHRFNAEELAVVRKFLRAGRAIYESQLERTLTTRDFTPS